MERGIDSDIYLYVDTDIDLSLKKKNVNIQINLISNYHVKLPSNLWLHLSRYGLSSL